VTSPRTPPPAPEGANRGRGRGDEARPDSTPTEPLLVSAKAAAELLGISARALWSLSNAGQVPSVRIGARRLYRPEALRAWVEALEQQGGRR